MADISPINYGALQSQLNLNPLQQGLAIRDNRVQETEARQERQAVRQLATAKFEADQQQDADYIQAVEAYKADPTPANLRDLGIRFPEKAKALMDAGDSYTSGQKRDLIGAGFSALGALSAGKKDLAIQTLQDRVTALKGSGVDTSHTQAAIDMIRNGDTTGATSYLSYAMSGLVGPDHAAGVMESLGVGKKAEDRSADNARADRALDLREQSLEASIARANEASARADRREARQGSGGGGKGGGDAYEYRIGPDGKLQRRKR